MKQGVNWGETVMQIYHVFQFVDNSGIAENHKHHRKQKCDEKYRWTDHFLCNNAAVDAPRYTESVDDVRAQKTHGCHKWCLGDPNQRDSTVHQILLCFGL